MQQNRTGSGTKCVRRRNDSWLLASLDSSKMNVLVLKRRSRLKEQIADVRQRQLKDKESSKKQSNYVSCSSVRPSLKSESVRSVMPTA